MARYVLSFRPYRNVNEYYRCNERRGPGFIMDAYPLHWFVWRDDAARLERHISMHKEEMERKDKRGRTPLHLAVSLGRTECARVLLANGADVTAENATKYTVFNEAISTGISELVECVLQCRDFRLGIEGAQAIPHLMERVQQSPDFYVEMTWEFSSWVPFLSRACPSDTYRIWKKGANVRIDTSLIGFDNMSWIRGNKRFLFKGDNTKTVFMEIDLDKKIVHQEIFDIRKRTDPIQAATPRPKAVAACLSNPNVSTVLHSDNISFSRAKSGLLGFRSDRTEDVGRYSAKVFSACDVEFVTRTRTEHLSEAEKRKFKGGGLKKLLGLSGDSDQEKTEENASATARPSFDGNPRRMSPDEYFRPGPNFKSGEHDIGRKPEVSVSSQKFKATLWMADEFPLSLGDQVLPVIELLAANISHFAKLRDFIHLHLPGGFPVKIEIPLFHVLNAVVTFSNINGSDKDAVGVKRTPSGNDSRLQSDRYQDPVAPSGPLQREGLRKRGGDVAVWKSSESSTAEFVDNSQRRSKIEIAANVFDVPKGLRTSGSSDSVGGGNGGSSTRIDSSAADESDELLQYAIQQSLLDSKCEENRNERERREAEVTRAAPPITEDEELRAIKQSMTFEPVDQRQSHGSPLRRDDYNVAMALRASEESERQRQQEEDELQRILKLSLTDK
ncbi:ankyrin repeat domain-containing protein 13B-like isoform X2 [Oscarella lobularis]|uniref:ankyrin repeat domain-containing protein 13B-like isoform X2 n=1 Tax=Oscarella lobularis TaxID=121494 RepID=UPI0033132BFC